MPDIEQATDAELIEELRSRGLAVQAVTPAAVMESILPDLPVLRNLTADEANGLAVKVMSRSRPEIERNMKELAFYGVSLYELVCGEFQADLNASFKRAEDLKAIVADLKRRGVQPEDLDDAVHDAAEAAGASAANQGPESEAEDALDAASAAASRANNEGLPGQVLFLLQHLGAEGTKAALSGLSGAPRP
jgi:hypothetical protein